MKTVITHLRSILLLNVFLVSATYLYGQTNGFPTECSSHESNATKLLIGKSVQLAPKSAEVFAKQTDEALRKLRHTSQRLNPARELPDRYWTDLVTEQPEGYVVDENGDVHLYSAEALAWLISVTNGLNGQEMDDFQGKTISLESNVDMSAAIWTPISNRLDMPPFKGSFDGKKHVIDGLQLTQTNLYAYKTGFFGNILEATLSNIVLRNGYFEGSGNGAGFLAFRATECLIDHCFVECEMHGDNIVPFIYVNNGSSISNCLVYSPLLQNDEDGLIRGVFVAENRMPNDSTLPKIINCASIIEQMEWTELCGIAGLYNHGLIENCFAYIGKVLNFPGYGGGPGPRNGVTSSNMGEIYNCYYNRIRDYPPSPNYYLDLDDEPTSSDEGHIQNALPYTEEGRGHWKLTEAITFMLENGQVSTDDLLDAMNFKVEELNYGHLMNWCDSGMSFNNRQLPVFCNFDITQIGETGTDNNGVMLYPNPATGWFAVKSQGVVQVEVYDMVGRRIAEQQGEDVGFDVSGWNKGIYLVRVVDRNGAVAARKLVVR